MKFFEILLIVAMLVTAISLILGVIQLFSKHKSPETSNRLMRIRVASQAIALGILAFLFMTKR